MDFDHVRGQKLLGLGKLVSQGNKALILKELEKCELVCANCHRSRTLRQRGRTKNKARLRFLDKMAQIKKAPCVDCGGYFPAEAMDFDHVFGTKVSNVSSLRTGSWDRVVKEIEKCDLVCANCHRIRTTKQKNKKEGNKDA
jgi:hypothetical protein